MTITKIQLFLLNDIKTSEYHWLVSSIPLLITWWLGDYGKLHRSLLVWLVWNSTKSNCFILSDCINVEIKDLWWVLGTCIFLTVIPCRSMQNNLIVNRNQNIGQRNDCSAVVWQRGSEVNQFVSVYAVTCRDVLSFAGLTCNRMVFVPYLRRFLRGEYWERIIISMNSSTFLTTRNLCWWLFLHIVASNGATDQLVSPNIWGVAPPNEHRET